MADDAMFDCIACGKRLKNVAPDCDNQPSEGTEFRSYGHYGSTFWDSVVSEEQVIINVCDDCLNKHKDRIGRQRRARAVTSRGIFVGRMWVTRAIVPYYAGEDHEPEVPVAPIEIGDSENLDNKVEWTKHWELTRESLMAAEEEELESE